MTPISLCFFFFGEVIFFTIVFMGGFSTNFQQGGPHHQADVRRPLRECMSTQLDRGAVLCGPSGAVAFPHQNLGGMLRGMPWGPREDVKCWLLSINPSRYTVW